MTTIHRSPQPGVQDRRSDWRAVRPLRFGGILWRLVRTTNAITVPFGGRRWLPLFAVVRHRGRRSGRSYATTVAARRSEGGFVISLAFGEQADWFKNVLAAGGCVVQWRGIDHPLVDPRIIGRAEGRSAFHPIQRLLLRLAGIDGYVRLRDAAIPAEGAAR